MWVGRAGGRLRFGGLSHTTVLPRSARPSGLVFSGLAPGPASAGCPGCARAAAALSLALFFFPLVSAARPSLPGSSRASGHASSSPGASFLLRPGPSGRLVASEAAPSVSDPRLGRMRLLCPCPGESPIPARLRDPHLSRLEVGVWGCGGGGARLSGRGLWLLERTAVTISSFDALWDPPEPHLALPCTPLYPKRHENSSSWGYRALPRLS